MAEVTEHRSVVGDVEVFWRRAEPDVGASPVLYVHGVPTSSDDWLPFLERAGGVAPDLPGFGRSDKPQGFDYSIAGYDRFLEQFLEAAGIERFSLVVHDWGVVGLAAAQRLHERLDRLVVFSSVPLLPGYRWHRVARIWRTPLAGEMFMGFSTKWAFKQLSKEANATPGPLPEALIDSVWEHFDHGTQRAILKLYRSAPPEVLERAGAGLGDITAPALILWPTEDPYIPERFGSAYADALGGEVKLEVVPRTGHWSWLDRPEQIEQVATFLST